MPPPKQNPVAPIFVGLRYLLPESVVRHQCVDDGRRRQTGDRKTFLPLQKVATADLTMNVPGVEFNGFAGNLRFLWVHFN